MILGSGSASAHGFGQRFDLPLPLWLWVLGAGATIVVSFAAVWWFYREREATYRYPRRDLLRLAPGRWLAGPLAVGAVRAAAAGLFVLVIATGLLGTPDPFRNLTTTTVWIIWWVGLAFGCALLGDCWTLVNPLRTLFAWAQSLYRSLSGGRELSRRRPFPPGLGAWPSVAGLLVFAWAELVWPENDVPRYLAAAILGYALLTWTGMWVFGRETWLEHAEVFTTLFGLLARFAPFETRVLDENAVRGCALPACRHQTEGGCVNGAACWSGAAPARRQWNLRPPAVGLLCEQPVPVPIVVFVLVMLSTVTFDGALETPLGVGILTWVDASPALDRTVSALREAGLDPTVLVMTLLLGLTAAAFVAAFLLFCWLGVAVYRRGAGPGALPIGTVGLARRFVLTLIPIAIAYHLAHYLSLLLSAGQFVIPLLSDPFGFGWDLLGTAGYRVDLSLIGARTVWYTAVAAIVFGHVCSVYLAHVTALKVFGEGRAVVVAQTPMLALMVLYTMLSLWILAQPIVS